MNTSAEWPLAPPAYSTSSSSSGAGSTSTAPTNTGASPAFTGPTITIADKNQMCKDNVHTLFGSVVDVHLPSIVTFPVHDRVVAAVVSSSWIHVASVPCGSDEEAINKLLGVLKEKIRLYLSNSYELYLKQVPGSRGWKYDVVGGS